MDPPYPEYENNLPSFDNSTWLSEVHPKYDFMEGVMWLANKSIASMFPAYSDFKGFKLDKEDLTNFDSLEINDIVWENASALPFIVVGLIYIFAMLIAGITWCCCKFCCCARKSYTKDNEESLHFGVGSPIFEDDDGKWSASKIACNILMGCWMIAFLFLLISAFTMNSTINKAIDDLPNDIDNPLTDAEEYLRITKEQFNAVFNVSYMNLTEVITGIVNSVENIPNYEDAYSKTEAFKIQKELVSIKEAFGVSSLAALNSVALLTFNSSLKKESSLLAGYFKELHSVDTQMGKLKEDILKTEDFINARNYLNKIGASKNWINLRAIFPKINETLEKVGKDLNKHNDDFAKAIDEIKLHEIRDEIKDIEDGMEIAKPYLYNTMWVVLSLLVVILAMVVFGTVLAALSKNKGCFRPAIYFNSGMLGIFISGFFLMMLCLVLYVLSGFFQIACQGIRDLERIDNTTSSELPGETCRVTDGYVLPLYENIVESCKMGESAYETLKLCQVYDINDVLKLSDEFNSSLSKQSSSMKELYEQQSYNHLENTLSLLKDSMQGACNDIKELLQLSKSFIETVNGKEIPETNHVEIFKLSFEKQAKNIEEKISAVESNLEVLGNIQVSAQNRQNPEDALDQIINQVDSYSKFVYNTTKDTIGECKPMYDALDATIEVFCYKVAFPVAGFWLTLAFLLLLYIPLMVNIETLVKISRKY